MICFYFRNSFLKLVRVSIKNPILMFLFTVDKRIHREVISAVFIVILQRSVDEQILAWQDFETNTKWARWFKSKTIKTFYYPRRGSLYHRSRVRFLEHSQYDTVIKKRILYNPVSRKNRGNDKNKNYK